MKLTPLVSLSVLTALAFAIPANKRDEFSEDAINVHNSYRTQYGGAQPLTYDDGLAAEAAEYANQCSWDVSKREGAGQNLNFTQHFASPPTATIKDAVDAWVDEVRKYDFDNPHFSEETGHFTQVVWKSTTKVGCARTVCGNENPSHGDSGEWVNIVCRYTSPGNVIGPGQFEANFGANPLTWGTSLASGAASFTSQCSWSLSSGNYGQNLYASTGSSATIQEAVENWMDQAPNYDYDHPGFNASTAAFTQVVWKASTTLGCGRSVCTTGNPFSGFNGPWTFIQCRYTPPGNVVGPGQYEANVGHPTGSQ
ncbi:hypothetical protein D9756_005479 [Leucocoprinus leucothites]|uniref:SCP domain-containing protein n=1 Tax=Leucocoprinus leucothites TaxID=201217 RepID=A0A8H5D9J1_9AGAR|nr:hypothetical protein D9756_005479 [Leucoagaricus leucothites]